MQLPRPLVALVTLSVLLAQQSSVARPISDPLGARDLTARNDDVPSRLPTSDPYRAAREAASLSHSQTSNPQQAKPQSQPQSHNITVIISHGSGGPVRVVTGQQASDLEQPDQNDRKKGKGKDKGTGGSSSKKHDKDHRKNGKKDQDGKVQVKGKGKAKDRPAKSGSTREDQGKGEGTSRGSSKQQSASEAVPGKAGDKAGTDQATALGEGKKGGTDAAAATAAGSASVGAVKAVNDDDDDDGDTGENSDSEYNDGYEKDNATDDAADEAALDDEVGSLISVDEDEDDGPSSLASSTANATMVTESNSSDSTHSTSFPDLTSSTVSSSSTLLSTSSPLAVSSSNSTRSNSNSGDSSSAAAYLAAIRAALTPRTRFCAQPENTNKTVDALSLVLVQKEKARLAKLARKLGRDGKGHTLSNVQVLANETRKVELVWHVIHDGAEGNLTRQMVEGQVGVLNADYADYGFQFNLNTTNYVDNADWFRNVEPGASQQDAMKSALHQGDEKTLNLYSVNFSNNLLGYSTFPWDARSTPIQDGVVFQYTTVPGGSELGYNEGKTATHEVGHWLGLYHVFQGGCTGEGDLVNDTPPQSVATNGCPTLQDSCPGGGVDSIHNYMDYSTDECLTMFTEGQAVRMAAISGEFRGL